MAIGARLRGILDELFSSADSTEGLINELYYDRGYPESVAERIAYGELDMRPGAIAERRRDFAPNMETFYHGGAADIGDFGGKNERGFDRDPAFVSDSPMLANTYVTQPGAGVYGARQGQIYPLAVDTRDFMYTSARGQEWGDMKGLNVYDPNQNLYVVKDGTPFYSKYDKGFDTDELSELAMGEEAPGIIIDDVVDIGPNFRMARKAYGGNKDLYQDFLDLERGSKVMAVNDPSRIRSLLGAAFDPEYTGSNILGERAIPVAGAGLLAAAAMSPEEAEAGVLSNLIKAGYPEEVAQRIASGDLPMDTASRMQRAEAMGFDPTDVQYHGTKADFTEFMPSEFGNVGPGVYMSVNPEVASGYASRNLYIPEEGAQVMPLLTRGETIGMRDYFAQYPDTAITQMPDTNAELRELGITAINEAAGAPDKAMFDPRDIRSLLGAAFDPEYKGSNILGGTAAGALGLTALMAPEEAEAGVIKTFGRAFDPRFDPRVKEQEKLRDTTFTIEERGTQDAPFIPLADLEGRPFVTTMSDRTQAGGLLTGIDDVTLNAPVNLQGGQGFMFENPGMVWASAPNVVNQIMRAASDAGDNPLYLPFRMAPTGGDFATMTGETMLSFASSNMSKSQKKALDKAIKDYESVGSMVQGRRVGAGLKIQDWKGIDDPSSVEVWRNTPDSLRKELMNMMDVQFRDKGGLSMGQARLAVTEPSQADALDAQIQNIGEIFTGQDVVQASGHPSYPAGVPGQGLGRTDQQVSIFELLPDARFGGAQRPVGDPTKPTAQEIRALQMKPYSGRITEDTLKALEARGVEVGSADPRLLSALAGGSGAGLIAMQNESVADTAERLRAESDTSGAYAPRSETLQDVTMALRGLERRLEGNPASLLFPSGYVQHLEEFNRPYERSTFTGALLGALDFL